MVGWGGCSSVPWLSHRDSAPRSEGCGVHSHHAMGSSLALAHRHDAMLSDLLLALGLGWGGGV